jgi:hypothetical protein
MHMLSSLGELTEDLSIVGCAGDMSG